MKIKNIRFSVNNINITYTDKVLRSEKKYIRIYKAGIKDKTFF